MSKRGSCSHTLEFIFAKYYVHMCGSHEKRMDQKQETEQQLPDNNMSCV